MADLFSRLAQRALGLAPVAKPSIAPLFAPGPDLVTESIVKPADQLKTTPQRDPSPAAEPLAIPARPDLPTLPHVPEWPPERLPAQPLDEPRRTERHLDRPDVPVTIPSNIQRAAPRQSQAEPLPPPWSSPQLPVAPPVLRESHTAAPAQPVMAEPLKQQPVFAPEPSTVYAPIEAAARTADPAPSPRSSVREERAPVTPAVKISIGRIEVRAVFPDPPAPSRISPEPRPVLTLADYLKQRDGGGR